MYRVFSSGCFSGGDDGGGSSSCGGCDIDTVGDDSFEVFTVDMVSAMDTLFNVAVDDGLLILLLVLLLLLLMLL